jgi:hypothetical protein
MGAGARVLLDIVLSEAGDGALCASVSGGSAVSVDLEAAVVSLSLGLIFWIFSSSLSFPSSMVSEVTSGAESDLSSDVRSSYPSRTSEKSEFVAVGLGSGMACVPGVVAARDASLAGALPGRIPVSNIFCKGSEGDNSCPCKTWKQRNKELG